MHDPWAVLLDVVYIFAQVISDNDPHSRMTWRSASAVLPTILVSHFWECSTMWVSCNRQYLHFFPTSILPLGFALTLAFSCNKREIIPSKILHGSTQSWGGAAHHLLLTLLIARLLTVLAKPSEEGTVCTLLNRQSDRQLCKGSLSISSPDNVTSSMRPSWVAKTQQHPLTATWRWTPLPFWLGPCH